RINCHAHIQQHRRRDAYVPVAGNVTQDETRNGRGEHQYRRNHESMRVPPHQSIVDEVLGKIRLSQTERAACQPDHNDQTELPGIRPEERLHAQEVAPVVLFHLDAVSGNVTRFVVVSLFRYMIFFDSSVAESNISMVAFPKKYSFFPSLLT